MPIMPNTDMNNNINVFFTFLLILLLIALLESLLNDSNPI